MFTTIFWVTFAITVGTIIFAVVNLVSYALTRGVFTDGFLDRIRRFPILISLLNVFTIIQYGISIITKSPVTLWFFVLIVIQCVATASFGLICTNIKFKRIDRFKQMCDYIEIKYRGKINMIYFHEWQLIHSVDPYHMDTPESYLERYDIDMMAMDMMAGCS